MDRWNNILQQGNDRQLWASINWKGTFVSHSRNGSDQPSDTAFCDHFSNLLNPVNAIDQRVFSPNTFRYMPILDDEIQPTEITKCVENLKPNKAAGIDGISPGN